MILDNIKNKIIELIKDNEEDIIKKTAEQFAYDYLYAPFYNVVYDEDNDYDYSGKLELDRNNLDLDNDIMEDFLNKHTGNSIPTYESYRGWYYETFEEVYEQFILEVIQNLSEECISEFINMDESLSSQLLILLKVKHKEEIFMELFDKFYDDLYELYIDIFDKFKALEPSYVYHLGEDGAKKRRELKIKAEAERLIVGIKQREDADRVWERFVSIFEETKGRKLDFKISKKEFNKISKILFDNFTKDELKLIGIYKKCWFSNSVASILEHGGR